MKKLILVGLSTLLVSCNNSKKIYKEEDRSCNPQTFVLDKPYNVPKIAPVIGHKVKNVILMIGDGMSLMHVYSAWTANRGKLFLDNAQSIALSTTYCADRLITDSGASGTAMATGHKTNYHSVGVDTLGNPIPSLIDLAHAKGLSTGIAVTCRIWDATPADFCCHNVDRDKEEDIVADYLSSPVDYVFGGGYKLFENRKDGRNILSELRAKGYKTPRKWEDIASITSGKVFALTDSVDTPLPKQRGDLLARASMKGIELLNKNPKGFFMMIEGSQIDDYGHFNNLDLLMQETLDFDRTVGSVFEWAAKDKETLVIVTSDHETGGLTLVDGDLKQGRIVCKFSTKEHSGVMVPIYTFGAGASEFTGIMNNTEIFDKIKKLLNL